MKHFFLLFVPLLLFSTALNAQFSIKAKVVSKSDNHSLIGAHCQLLNSNKTTISSLEGLAIFEDLKKGYYTLQVSYVGFKTIQKEIRLDKNILLVIEMEDSIILEDEVIIMATRANSSTASSFQNISKVEIKQANIGQDLPFILQNSPSVVINSDAGTGIGYTGMRIRGTDATRINFTINGIPFNDAESNGVYFVNMPDFAASLNSIQIQRGVGTSTNGAAAFGASVNMLTSDYKPQAATELSTSMGSFNSQLFRIGLSTGLIDNKWSFDGRFSKINSAGFIDRASSDLKSYFFSGAFYGNRSILRFNVFSGIEKTYQAWNGVPKVRLQSDATGMQRYLDHGLYSQAEYDQMLASNPRTYNLYTYENETDNYQQDHYQLLFSKEISSKWNLNSALHYTRGKGYYENYKADKKFSAYGLSPAIIGNDTIKRTDLVQQKWLDNHFYGMTFNANYNSKKKIKAILGGALNQYRGNHFGEIIWSKIALQGKDYEWYRSTGIKTDFNVFGKINYMLNGRTNVYADVQYRKVQHIIEGIDDDLRKIDGTYTFDFINPKFGIVYNLKENQDLYVSVAVANREPNRSNYTDADSGFVPKPERLTDFEAGYGFKGKKIDIKTNVFYMMYKDQLVETGKVNNVGSAIMMNVDNSYRMGLEVSAAAKINTNIKWNLSLSLSENKILNFTEYVDDWDNWGQADSNLGSTVISFSPALVASNIFQFDFKKLPTIFLISRFVSRQYIDNTSNLERSIDPYFVNDVKISYTFKLKNTKSVALSLSINNILNTEYETSAWAYRYILGGNQYTMDGYFPQAGINLFGGVTFNF